MTLLSHFRIICLIWTRIQTKYNKFGSISINLPLRDIMRIVDCVNSSLQLHVWGSSQGKGSLISAILSIKYKFTCRDDTSIFILPTVFIWHCFSYNFHYTVVPRRIAPYQCSHWNCYLEPQKSGTHIFSISTRGTYCCNLKKI